MRQLAGVPILILGAGAAPLSRRTVPGFDGFNGVSQMYLSAEAFRRLTLEGIEQKAATTVEQLQLLRV
jgi:hypothetical protein